MATDKPRFSVTFSDDSFEKIRKYQIENNISTQSKAVARLVELAISELEAEPSKKNSPGWAMGAQVESPQAGSSPESSIAEQIKSVYGETVIDTFSMYVLLDAGDQGEIRGEIKQMLKQSKYLKQEGNLA